MPRNLDGVAEETTESCDDIASEPVMETAVEDLLALNFQSTEVTAAANAEEPNCAAQVACTNILKIIMEVKAEHAEEPEDTPEDEAVDVDDKGKGYTEWIVNPHNRPPDGGGGAPELLHEGNVGDGDSVKGVQGKEEYGCGLHDEPPDAIGGVTVPDQLDEDEPGALVGEVRLKPPGLPDGDVPGAAVGDVQVKSHGLLVVWYDRDVSLGAGDNDTVPRTQPDGINV